MMSSEPDVERGSSQTALLIIDMINGLDFPGADRLAPPALAAAERIDELRRDARNSGVPIIFVNDNYEQWHADHRQLVERCRNRGDDARKLIERLHPGDGDLFIIKPQFSGFYATNLPVLLPRLGVSRLVLTGVATDICVLFTAADAHMRDYDLWVPCNAVASSADEHGRWALETMQKSMNARTDSTEDYSLKAWLAERFDRSRDQ